MQKQKGQLELSGASNQIMGVLFLIVIVAAFALAISGMGDVLETDSQLSVSNENFSANGTNDYTLLEGGGNFVTGTLSIVNADAITFTLDTNYTLSGTTVTWISAGGNGTQVNASYTVSPSTVAKNATGSGLTLVENVTTQFGTIGTLIGVGLLIGVVFLYFRFTGKL